jgi:hypothetical protein
VLCVYENNNILLENSTCLYNNSIFSSDITVIVCLLSCYNYYHPISIIFIVIIIHNHH